MCWHFPQKKKGYKQYHKYRIRRTRIAFLHLPLLMAIVMHKYLLIHTLLYLVGMDGGTHVGTTQRLTNLPCLNLCSVELPKSTKVYGILLYDPC